MEFVKISYSPLVNWNMKSSGKRSMFRLTDWFNTLVCTPYMAARSKSSMTFMPLIS